MLDFCVICRAGLLFRPCVLRVHVARKLLSKLHALGFGEPSCLTIDVMWPFLAAFRTRSVHEPIDRMLVNHVARPSCTLPICTPLGEGGRSQAPDMHKRGT